MTAVFKAVCGKISGKENGKWGNFCCLCFTSVGKDDGDAVFVNDRFTLEHNATSEILAKILVSVLGSTVTENMSVTEMVCKKCSLDAVTSYKFIENCKKHNEALVQAVQNLSSCLENVSKSTSRGTLFISVNPTKKSIQRFFDLKEQNKLEQTALARFSSIIYGLRSSRSPHLNTPFTYDAHSSSDDINVEKKKSIKKKLTTRRKLTNMRDLSTLAIKTCDLIADPSNLHDYRCKICLKEYPYSASLRAHFFQEHSEQRFQCRECDKSYGTEGRLQTHIQISHRWVICSKCGKKISNQSTCIQRHELAHQRRLQKVCHKCGKVFRKMADFERHKGQTCQVPLPVPESFTCDHCNYRCISESQMITHIKLVHQAIRIHSCQMCLRKFYTAYSLTNHIVTHSHLCPECGRTFVKENALINHMRLHTGERPFICDVCGMGFVTNSQRKYHIESRHDSTTFECDICHNVYRARDVIVKHMKKKHPEFVAVK